MLTYDNQVCIAASTITQLITDFWSQNISYKQSTCL